MSRESKQALDRPPLHPVQEMKAWVREDLLSLRNAPEDLEVQSQLIDQFLDDFEFDTNYRKLETLDFGVIAGGRMRLRHTLLSLNFVATVLADPGKTNLVARATSLLVAARDLHEAIADGSFQPDVYKGVTLNMDQFSNFFGTTQIPGPKANYLHRSTATYVAVLARGHAFKLALYQEGRPLKPGQILWQLERILALAAAQGEGRLGLASCDMRADCSAMREELRENPVYAASLEALDDALFVLALDVDSYPTTMDEVARHTFSRYYRNRWYDKSLQIVVAANGEAGCIASYACYIDGSVGIRFAADLQKTACKVVLGEAEAGPEPIPLPMGLKAETIERTEKVVRAHLREEQSVFVAHGTAMDFFKEMQVSPDSSVQMALLLGARKFFGRPVSLRHYVSLRHFPGGTLDLPYMTTPEIELFLDAANSGVLCHRDLGPMFQQAVLSHKDIIKRAASGCSPKLVFNCACVDEDAERIARLRERVEYYREQGFRKYVGDSFGADEHTAEIITSAMRLAPETPVVGRPGIRLPYLAYFGLHYFILSDRIVFVYMPAPRCPNDVGGLHLAVEEGLAEVRAVLEANRDAGE